jgi:hypothetical protein
VSRPSKRGFVWGKGLIVPRPECSCFLVTYYFTQELLSPYSDVSGEARTSLDERVVAFVKLYGAYLQIHSCLSFSSAVRAEAAIAELLKVSSHDPSHRDAVREIQKGNALTFYDTVSFPSALGLYCLCLV